MGLTSDICEIMHATRYESLGDECVARVKQAIQDGVAVALAGCGEPPVTLALAHAKSLGGAPQASVWGAGFKASVVQAANLNAMATHVLDFEPMWSPPTHSVSPTVPVAFALAELNGATGREIIAAVAKGLEIQGRLQYAGDQFVPEQLLFHPPGVAGVLGSAIVASTLLGLDVNGMRHAFGIAASRAGSLLANVGSMTKCTHCGNAAASGLDAALLAQRGFTANPAIFEARAGYVATFFDAGFDYAALLAFGRPFRCVDPGIAIKFYPSKYPTHYAIGAALELRRAIPDISRVTALRIVTPEIDDADRPQPRSGLEGKFSFQYTAAIALLDGAVGIASFTDERRFRADVTALLGKISLMRDATIPRDTRTMRVEIEADLSDGARERAVCTKPPGSWGAPVDPALHAQKMRDCLRTRLAPEQLAPVLAALDRLEQLNAREVGALIARLTVTKSA